MALHCSKRTPALLRGIRSKHHRDFYCLNCLHSFRTKKPVNLKKVFEDKNVCNVITSSEDIKILKFNQYRKYDEVSFIIYAIVNF